MMPTRSITSPLALVACVLALAACSKDPVLAPPSTDAAASAPADATSPTDASAASAPMDIASEPASAASN